MHDAAAAAHAVALVVDPEFGDRVAALCRRLHVWIVRTPTNCAAADRVHAGEGASDYSLERGISTFSASPDDAPDVVAADMLSTIDEHHGRWSHDPPWTVLEVFGTPPTDALTAALSEFGFVVSSCTPDGFTATRSENDAA